LKKLSLIFFLSVACACFSRAQNTCSLSISLLTCAPGEELYSTFGHTAIRVKDSTTGTDYVFNYGTFEFGPDFYTKFIRGKLLYFLSVEEFNEFMSTYRYESRSVIEQELALDCNEKQKLYTALQINATPENRYYKYDFLFDNCTSRARDIIRANTAQPVVFKNIFPGKTPTFRELIHSYLNAGHQDWSKFGIDILLGAKLDATPTNEQAMFLPDNLLAGIDSSVKNGKSLAASKQTILELPSPLSKASLVTPMILFSVLLGILILISFSRNLFIRKIVVLFDFLFFFTLGLAGLLLLFMWFGTDHKVTSNNYNLLWALPTHVAGAFFTSNRKRWTNYYWLGTIIIQAFLLIAWIFLPQQLNLAVLPVVLIILLRAWLIILKPHYGRTES
jgi:hypothetical protein